jgi:phage baseplate assembly protein W
MPYQIVNINDINQQQPNQAIGINFPFNGRAGLMSATYTTMDQLISNFKNLLLTYKGERFYHYNFGTNLPALLFEPNTLHIKEQVSETITDAVSYWLPQINIVDIETTTAEEDPTLNCQIKITISFEASLSTNANNLNTITIFVDNTNTLTVQ